MSEGSRPASLLVRTNLILAVSSLLIALIVTTALNVFVIDSISQRSADDAAARLVLAAQVWVELPPGRERAFEAELFNNHGLIITSDLQDESDELPQAGYFRLLQEKLEKRLGQPVRMQAGDDLVWVTIPVGEQSLQVGFVPTLETIQPLYFGIVIVVAGAVIVLFTSFLIVRRIARPLMVVADRVEAFRGNIDFEPLPETGPREIASLAHNVNTMAQEISLLLSNRTTLLAGISHDLRTPLTRMRLAVELLPESVDPQLVSRLSRNLETMDRLIADALSFARGAEEHPQRADIDVVLRDVVGSFMTPVEYRVVNAEPKELDVAVSALRRVLENLLVNGIQHGGTVRLERDGSRLSVIDDGAGIPEEFREQVFQPFFRLDEARSTTTGGSGLGLAIVRQLCQSQGWAVWIDSSSGGGACVVVELKPSKR
ncbi:MAG: HAMP domain-containing protein [Pseudomonadales bacterium]|nr:HAMP domain-containing protein [Pseudomonadales bacterium]MCP5185712.1 HAMP domain-containing protein [Pseudomonadales bacterium]